MSSSLFLKQMTVFGAFLIISNSCMEWDESSIKIERFKYLDAFHSTPTKNDSLLVEAYLIHGYKKKYEDRIQAITDKFICDSIIPNSRFYRTKYITFFERTQNTNRENFRTRLKHKQIYARSRDKLFSYRINVRDSSLFRIRKIHEASGTEVTFQDFYCE